MTVSTKQGQSEGAVWDRERLASPHAQSDKSHRVRRMFDAIAPTYERVNRLASAGRDAFWRREMVRLASVRAEDVLLDVACGTGDVVRAFAGAAVRPCRIVGADFALEMLRLAQCRSVDACTLTQADALALPLREAAFSLVTCAFGIRNFQDLGAGLRQMHRVLCPGGRAVILEFSLPRSPLLRRLYIGYFRKVMPRLAGWLSGDRVGAYRYLPESVLTFLDAESIRDALHSAGFREVEMHRRTCGIVTIYVAHKTVNHEAASV